MCVQQRATALARVHVNNSILHWCPVRHTGRQTAWAANSICKQAGRHPAAGLMQHNISHTQRHSGQPSRPKHQSVMQPSQSAHRPAGAWALKHGLSDLSQRMCSPTAALSMLLLRIYWRDGLLLPFNVHVPWRSAHSIAAASITSVRILTE